MINIESIKGKIRNLAEKKNLKSQEVLQIYFFERLLERLSKSQYKNNFVIKGGFLISSLIGIENRTTMDMDTTIKGIALKEDRIKEIVEEILDINVDDGIRFEIKDISYIREEDKYENFRISLIANVGKTQNPMKIDITTGDAITPREIEYAYPCIFSKKDIKIMAYPLETILAEKYETIIRRNITTTRMRDFYDLYTLYKLKKDDIDYEVLKEAVKRTSNRRGSQEMMKDYEKIIEDIKEDSYLRSLWDVYLKENKYIGDLSFDKVVDVVTILSNDTKLC
ncbi:MAG: nucleotidyl transferase AbiEii/AbiGii toxin family protein [Lactobacillus iners]|uniref:nucleotidyl transferase AbiEii/AbiGii toxin family protein n=1 Tax=Lactobacillus iners TaxID=147802 RepID=UPI00254B69FE|nr:nucleotidyl transferase AbiEii/AbiGii toxin family protein [Lactobacillus iners]MCT7677676.1 nucleotidyl transferase AbiEii/AbiGii toxin family protein [Lactobacillus iners]MCT7693102.1 nucleotidyl transferase AbiEii/AbiGii toxin family protein [Lactobacillus iners]MCT7695846.1 nucleotidyl transferase AbiEii/AbiGii toxin family protein [Lactobacillus iners]MCT7717956.1 nucleotidyl transferase AbiEii/AbiGii toxin family protein [Lactobacillus iners]MCT7743679.1 nucleotidyl transferase AbiEii